MKGITSVIVMVAGFQVITSQGPPENMPEQCKRPPHGVEKPHECCKIPPFFTDKDFEDCGFQKSGGTGQHRPGPPDCSKQMCMLEKYRLLIDKKDIDHKALKAYMDQWAETNESFKPSVAIAKEKCVGKELPGPPQLCEANKLVFCISSVLFAKCVGKELPGPPQLCEANKLVFCISSVLFAECPVWEKSEGCQKLKNHFDLCKPYFFNH